MELVADVLPPGVINVVNGGGAQLGRAVVDHGLIDEGYGCETDQQTLRNYQEVNKVLFNHDPKPLGFFV